MTYALLFAGQGTQYPDMLQWLEAEPACAPLIIAMQHEIGSDWRLQLQAPEIRSSNPFAQTLVTGTALAAWAAVARHLKESDTHAPEAGPAIVAGYSVGELAAFACAGVFDAQTAIALAGQRAAMMDASVANTDTGLLSVSGLRVDTVTGRFAQLDCAIYLAPDHGIYAGESAALEEAVAILQTLGAICKRLDVRVASHSRWMVAASEAFARHLAGCQWQRPTVPIALNATGAATRQPDVLRQALAQQISSTVQWASCMDAIAESGVRCVLEVGAGVALSKLWNQRYPDIAARSLDEFRNAEGAARWIVRNRGD